MDVTKTYNRVTIFARRSLLLFATIIGFQPTPSLAGEGFYQDHTLLPATVQEAWNSVFMAKPIYRGGTIASAVLVAKDEVGPNQYLLTFASADHVIETICGSGLGHCDNLELTIGKALKIDDKNNQIVDELPLGRKQISIRTVEVVRRMHNPDLALFTAHVSGSIYSSLKPLKVASNCRLKRDQQVFIVGYPIVAERKNSDIEYKEFVIKRWSSGYLVTNTTTVNKFDNSIEHHTGSTADAINGNSGGATVNLAGELIGIHDSSAGKSLPGSPYVGNEYSSPKKYHARFTRCEYLDDFINMRTVSVNPEDYYKRPRVASNQDSGSIVRTSYSK